MDFRPNALGCAMLMAPPLLAVYVLIFRWIFG
jgi:hypothetical protein